MTNQHRARALVACAAAAALSILAAPSAAKETKLKSEVVATESINPNRRGVSQPVKIYVYYLAHDEAFTLASFNDLVALDAPVLGDELIRRAEFLIGPGETLELDEEFDEAAKFIGVVAAFTAIGEASWRAVAEVPAKRWTDVLRLWKSNKLQILIDGTSVSCEIIED